MEPLVTTLYCRSRATAEATAEAATAEAATAAPGPYDLDPLTAYGGYTRYPPNNI